MKNICFQMTRKGLVVMLFALCLAFPALAQKITVQGTVVDSTGEPLIGASVLQQGTTTGTSTDFDGNFQLQVDANATLVVSYVGCETQKVAVKGQKVLNIKLADSGVKLDEVVAIGYGVVKKNDATGSVSTVKPSEIQAGLATSAQDLLVGQTPGVVVTSSGGPEGSAAIRIRGGSSLSASNDPLIVIDGVPMDNSGTGGMGNSLSMVAPDNIENMTVLKDASATAIYGSRASNGVIIITTKKGKTGRPQVNFTANMYVNTAAKTWKTLNAEQFGDAVRLAVERGIIPEAAIPAMGKANTNWQDEVLRTSVSSDYNLSVGGQVGVLPYRVSASYTNNQGIVKNNSMDRVTAGFNLSPKFFNGLLSINANVKGYFIKNNFTGGAGAVGAAVSMDPTSPVYANYKMAPGQNAGVLFNGYYTWMSGASYNNNSTNNPVSVVSDNNNKAEIWGSNGNLQIDYALHFFPDLHLNLNLGYDVAKSNGHNIVTPNSPLAWSGGKGDGAGTDYSYHQFKSNTLLDFYLNYRKEFNGNVKNNLDVTAGYSWQRFHQDGWNNGTLFTTDGYKIGGNATDGYTLSFGEARRGTYISPVYKWANHLQLLSFFGRVNYSLQNRYLLTVTVRGDATSRFSKENRWGIFPAVSLAWKLSEEKFFESARDVVNEFKVRGGWGITGQQDIGAYYPYLATYTQAQQGSYYPNLLDPSKGNTSTLYPEGYDGNLKWESTTTWNAGIDLGFLNNRITAAIDYYFRETKDLLSYVTIPVGSATTNAMNQNIGSLENQGVEFSLTARPVVTKDFTWTLNYNVSYNKNKITKLNNDGSYIQTGGISAGTGNTIQVHQVGYPAFSYLVYQQVYDKQGKPIEGEFVDQNADGQIDDADLVIHHSKDPKVTMTFGSTFNWKGWDLGFSLRANIGNYVYNDVLANHTSYSSMFMNNNLRNLIENDMYFDGNKSTLNIALSDYWVRNGSFLRCDNITLGYTWANVLKSGNTPLRIRLYGAVQNPFIITKYKGLDPEVFSGIDNNVYPRAITATLGVVATF